MASNFPSVMTPTPNAHTAVSWNRPVSFLHGHLDLLLPPAGKLSPDFLVVASSSHSVSSHVSSRTGPSSPPSNARITCYHFTEGLTTYHSSLCASNSQTSSLSPAFLSQPRNTAPALPSASSPSHQQTPLRLHLPPALQMPHPVTWNLPKPPH